MRKVARNLNLLLLGAGLLIGVATVTPASAAKVTFEITDQPGSWFRNTAGGGSLAVVTPGTEVVFTGKSNTAHTRTSLIFPTGSINMPFDTEPRKGSDSVMLHTPGLYVFTCKIHPYMFGAVIVDDPATTAGLDLGREISLVNGIKVPTFSDLALRLLHTFFIATNPANWKDYTKTEWKPAYPKVPVIVYDAAGTEIPVSGETFASVLAGYDGNVNPNGELHNPDAAVGEIWVDTQFEKTKGKTKPGTATAIDGATWQARRKVALPQINMNNPHNMWTDKNQNLIYQTQWFDTKLAVFNRITGRLVSNITVGEAPSHVMTQVGSDKLHVALNGSTDSRAVVELAANAGGILRRIDIGAGHPHAHWMGHNGELMMTPNALDNNSTEYNFTNDTKTLVSAGALPIATGMTPDSKKAYVASLLDSTITVIDTETKSKVGTIDLLKIGTNYFPLDVAKQGNISGPIGALPIQTPVSPDGQTMVTANTLSGTITIVKTATNEVVKMLPCDPGCHGVQFGAKQGGGYYAYVSSKFSNALIVVGFDSAGNPESADIAGRILLTATASTAKDASITGLAGMGGQGILTIPVVYNGWVQQLPDSWKSQLSDKQRDPLK